MFFFFHIIKICQTRPKYFFFSSNDHIGTPPNFLNFFSIFTFITLLELSASCSSLYRKLLNFTCYSGVCNKRKQSEKKIYHQQSTKLQIFALIFSVVCTELFSLIVSSLIDSISKVDIKFRVKNKMKKIIIKALNKY